MELHIIKKIRKPDVFLGHARQAAGDTSVEI
jgi:hypothetical protein